METFNQNNADYQEAKERVKLIKKFWVNFTVFILVFCFFQGVRFYKNGVFELNIHKISLVFWIWGMVIAVKAIRLFVFDYHWEKKEIGKMLKRK